MKRLLPIGTLGLAGVVGIGLLVLPGATASASSDEQLAAKREDSATELVLVADEDDDDSDDTGNTNTGPSASTGDGTRSNVTAVSRDRDLSRSDKTKDFTLDGPGDTRTRDWTANSTNDRSRNDTRG